MDMYESFYPQRLWIDYPQERIDGQMYKYRCRYCKIETTKINGKIDGHGVDCTYRRQHTYIELED